MRVPTLSAMCLVLAFANPGVTQQAAFYVAPSGNDQWSGTKSTANEKKTDGPFATLARAQQAVRQHKANATPGQPITVLVRGGRYELTEPNTPLG
jgi:hypothetical protein